MGNLGRDPELRYTPQGNAVCDFSVAVNDRKRDKTGEWQDFTTWFKVTFWGKQAENASKYLSKGRQVYAEGRLQVEEWTDRDGKNRFSLAIQGTELHFISDTRNENNFENTGSERSGDEYSGTQDSAQNTSFDSSQAGDDDIPF